MKAWLFETMTAAVFLLACGQGAFAEEIERSGFRGGIDVGAGRVERSVGGFEREDTNVYLGFKAGYAVHPQVLVGAELSGWNQEATDRNDRTKSEGLMQLFVIGRLYPMRNSNLFARVDGGWARQWANGPGGKFVLDEWAATPFLNYGFGETGDLKYQLFTLGAGITFY